MSSACHPSLCEQSAHYVAIHCVPQQKVSPSLRLAYPGRCGGHRTASPGAPSRRTGRGPGRPASHPHAPTRRPAPNNGDSPFPIATGGSGRRPARGVATTTALRAPPRPDAERLISRPPIGQALRVRDSDQYARVSPKTRQRSSDSATDRVVASCRLSSVCGTARAFAGSFRASPVLHRPQPTTSRASWLQRSSNGSAAA